MAAYPLEGQSWIAATETVWPAKPIIFTIWTFIEKVCWSLDYKRTSSTGRNMENNHSIHKALWTALLGGVASLTVPSLHETNLDIGSGSRGPPQEDAVGSCRGLGNEGSSWGQWACVSMTSGLCLHIVLWKWPVARAKIEDSVPVPAEPSPQPPDSLPRSYPGKAAKAYMGRKEGVGSCPAGVKGSPPSCRRFCAPSCPGRHSDWDLPSQRSGWASPSPSPSLSAGQALGAAEEWDEWHAAQEELS